MLQHPLRSRDKTRTMNRTKTRTRARTMIIDFLKDNRGPAAYRLPPDENPIPRTQFSVQANDEQIDEKIFCRVAVE